MLIELKTFVENLTCDCIFNAHHTSGIDLTGPNFLARKPQILAALDEQIEHGDMDQLATRRKRKQTL